MVVLCIRHLSDTDRTGRRDCQWAEVAIMTDQFFITLFYNRCGSRLDNIKVL